MSNLSPKEKFENVMLNFYRTDPVMLSVLNLLDFIEDPTQNSIGLDTHSALPKIKYNKSFVDNISEEMLEHILAMEGLKLLLRHPKFRDIGTEPFVAAAASKMTVGEMQAREFMKLLSEDSIKELFPCPENYDMQSGDFYEVYAAKINDDFDNFKEMVKQMFAMSDSESGQGDGESQNGQGQSDEDSQDGQSQGQGSSSDGNDGQQEGDGQGQGQGQGQGNGKEYKDQNEALKEYFNPMGNSHKDWGDNSILDEQVKQIVKYNDNSSSKSWGSHTGNYREHIRTAFTEQVNVRKILNQFGASVVKEEEYETRTRLSRRFPGLMPGETADEKSKIIFFVDVSGSMSSKVIEEAFAYIEQFIKHAWIDVACFDTEVTDIWKNIHNKKNEWVITGRGGTDFNEVIRFIDKQTPETRYDGCIVITDSYASMPNKPKYKDTRFLWILTEKGNTNWNPGFGITMFVEDILKQQKREAMFRGKK